MKRASCLVLGLILLFFTTSCGTSSRDVSCNCCMECECESCSKATASTEDATAPSTEEDNKPAVSSTSSSISELDRSDASIIREDEELAIEYEKVLYNKAKEMYLSGEWDGTHFILEGHEISLSTATGSILVDSHEVTSFPYPADLPDSFTHDMCNSNYEYIPGRGVYVIKDKTLVKYVRGEKIPLDGGSIDWKGFDPKNARETGYLVYGCDVFSLNETDNLSETDEEIRYYLPLMEPCLFYVPEADHLLFHTFDPAEHISYLYFFPNYDVSEVELLSTLSDYACHDSAFFYTDTNGFSWKYSANGPELYPHNYD